MRKQIGAILGLATLAFGAGALVPSKAKAILEIDFACTMIQQCLGDDFCKEQGDDYDFNQMTKFYLEVCNSDIWMP